MHVGNSLEYLHELLGHSQVVRHLKNETKVEYYYRKKFLLMLFSKRDRVNAYIVIPLTEDFKPIIDDADDKKFHVGKQTFFAKAPFEYDVVSSNQIQYYIESKEAADKRFHLSYYAGWVNYGYNYNSNIDEAKYVFIYYKSLVMDDEEKNIINKKKVRSNVYPNFYGVGELKLAIITEALLTEKYFKQYF
ncbi:MAG: hypothetical protein HN826_15485 [Methylococcales bacterium]|jgi:hypothetical protein|nr:hypothetical protein [Methylococcales bacterium]